MRPVMEAPQRGAAPELGAAEGGPGSGGAPRRRGARLGARWRWLRPRLRRWTPRLRKRDLMVFWGPLAAVCLLAVALAYREPIREAARERSESLREAVVEHPDFAVRRVEIAGRRETPQDAVLRALGLENRATVSSLAYDVEAARARLLAEPWIEDATVALHPSGALRVRLTERRAAALWRGPEGHWLIDAEGAPILRVPGPQARLDLPYLIGSGAPEAAAEARTLLFAAPRDVAREITALVRRGGRRWDAVSSRGFVIKLPQEAPLDALRRYGDSRLGARLAGRAVIGLDLRRPQERPVLRLAPGAAALRREALAALEGAPR